jgi:hypothetical protein
MTAQLIHPDPLTARSGLNRRNFLGLGVAFSGSLLLPIVFKAANRTTTQSHPVPTPALGGQGLAIGFLPHTAGANQTLMAAHDLASGDRAFVERGAQVTIQQLYRPSDCDLTGLTAYLHYHPEQCPAAIKVPVWSYQQAGVMNVGATNRLLVPVAAATGLTLSFEWQTQADRATIVMPLAIDQTSDRPKLQRGTYLIAGQRQSTAELPLWTDYRWQSAKLSESNQLGELSHGDRQTTQPLALDFPYLSIAVDYGDA